jgi:adenylate cyclase
MSQSPLFQAITEWLLERALIEAPLSTTVQELGRRMVDGGVPVSRINIGALILHPVLGALDLTWDAENDLCTNKVHARKQLLKIPNFTNAPFYDMCANNIPFLRFRLSNEKERTDYPLLETLHNAGINDYVALSASFGKLNRPGFT